MASGCITGEAKRKDSAPLTFLMDSGVLCTAFGTNNALCKFADFVFTFLRDNYGLKAAGFIINPLIEAVTDNPRVAGYYDSDAGRFDLSIAARAKGILEILSTAQDVIAALDSLKLDEFDTDEFCASNPLLTPVPITYNMILNALIPFGGGFDELLEAVTKNWIIIKFAEYCECEPTKRNNIPLPQKPPKYKDIIVNLTCYGTPQEQAQLDATLAAIDNANDLLGEFLAKVAVPTGQWTDDFPFDDMEGLYKEYLQENNLDSSQVNALGGFPAYYQSKGGAGYQFWLENPDRLFPNISLEGEERYYGLKAGANIKTKLYPASINQAGISNQIFTPGQEPPCKCELIIGWEKVQIQSLLEGVKVDGALNIRTRVSIPPTGYAPDDAQLDAVIPRLGNAYAYPQLVFTRASCPSYFKITDDDLTCLDFPDLCTCKKITNTVIVPIKTGCDIDEQEDTTLTYYTFEGASCIKQTISVDIFDKCGDPLVPLEITYDSLPNVLQ